MSSFLFVPVAAGVATGITCTVIHDCVIQRKWCSDQSSDEKEDKGAVEMESKNNIMNGMPTTDTDMLQQNLESVKREPFQEQEKLEKEVDQVLEFSEGINLSPANSEDMSQKVLGKYKQPYWESFALSTKNLPIRNNIAWSSIGTVLEFVLTAILGRGVGALASFLSCYSIADPKERLRVLIEVDVVNFESVVYPCQILSTFLILQIWMIKYRTPLSFIIALGHAVLCFAQWFSLAAVKNVDPDSATFTQIDEVLDELYGNHTRVFALLLAAFILHGVSFIYRRLTTVRKLENTCCSTCCLVLMGLLGGMVAFMWGVHTWPVEVVATQKEPRMQLLLYLATFRSPMAAINTFCGIAVVCGMIGMTVGSVVYKKYKWLVLNLSVAMFVIVLMLMLGLDMTSSEKMYDCVKNPLPCFDVQGKPTESMQLAIDHYNTIHPALMVQWLLVKVVVALNLLYFQDFCIPAQALLNAMFTYEGAIVLWGITAVGVALFNEFDSNQFKILKSTNQVVHLLGDVLVVSYHTGMIPYVVCRQRMHAVLYGLGFFMAMALMIPGAEENVTWQKFLLGHIGDTGLSIAEFTVLAITMTTPGMWDSALISSMGRAVHGFSLLLGRFFLWHTMCGYWALWFGLGTLYGGLVIIRAFFWTELQREHFASRTHTVTEEHWPKLLLLVALIASGATLKEYSFAEFVDKCFGVTSEVCNCFTDAKLTYTNANIAPASTLTNIVWLMIIMGFLTTMGYTYSNAMTRLQRQSWEELKHGHVKAV